MDTDCSSMEADAGSPSGYGVLRNLTHPCRYNLMIPPRSLNISTRIYIYNSQAVHNLVRTF
jgi:hypothetical protein